MKNQDLKNFVADWNYFTAFLNSPFKR